MTSTSDLTIPSLFSVEGYVCLVTGGATGLGEMAAQAFIQNGAELVIIASRKESELKKTSERLNGLSGVKGRCEYIVADLKDRKGVEGLVAETKKKTGRLNVLFNCSGATW